MIKRFHGIDRHKEFSTISVLDRDGREVQMLRRCKDLRGYVGGLGSEDAVVLEAGTGSFWWADQVESRGASCYIIDPYKFKVIRESWKKTDKLDARNMVRALRVYLVTGEFGIPCVNKPAAVIRDLRQLFSHYRLLNRQLRVLKNRIQAMVSDCGIPLGKTDKKRLLSSKSGERKLEELEVSGARRVCLRQALRMLWVVEADKKALTEDIVVAGEPLKKEVLLLITVTGVTPLFALAFLSDVGDVGRFSSLRKMSAYLGLVPCQRSSGGKTQTGHINRQSRKLTRTLFTQSLRHVANSSSVMRKFYETIGERRGWGRARIALIRKLVGIMRAMLLSGETYRWMKQDLYQRKAKKYQRVLQKRQESKKAA